MFTLFLFSQEKLSQHLQYLCDQEGACFSTDILSSQYSPHGRFGFAEVTRDPGYRGDFVPQQFSDTPDVIS
jgi:hypothetical protein